jgi:hypothetical protein
VPPLGHPSIGRSVFIAMDLDEADDLRIAMLFFKSRKLSGYSADGRGYPRLRAPLSFSCAVAMAAVQPGNGSLPSTRFSES